MTKELDKVIGKLPPQAKEVEDAVLGGVLLSHKALNAVVDILRADLFYYDKNRHIMEVLLKMYDENETIDILTVTQQARKQGVLESCGGAFYITTLTSKINSSANIEAHIRILQEMYMRRKMIEASDLINKTAYDEKEDVFEGLSVAEKSFTDITNITSKKETLTIYQSVKEALNQINERQGRDGTVTGLPSGIKSIDSITSGFQNSDLIILAARPGMGKLIKPDEIVMTPVGPLKIKDINVDDDICGTDGKVYKVLGKYPQKMSKMFKLTFDDGLSIDACEDHLWEVQDRNLRKKGSKEVRVMPTKEILSEGLYVNGTKRKNFSIKYAKPAYHTKKKTIIPPYILGLLIGDGYLSSNKVSFSNSEEDIINIIKDYFGDKVVRQDNRKIDYRINGLELKSQLKEIGLLNKLSHNKFIPQNYLYSDIEDRTMLLRGLIDTDGNVVTGNSNYIEYSTTSEQLRKDIMTLARGLGGRCSFTQRMGKYKKDGVKIETRINYRIWISFDDSIIPVSSKKHLEKYTPNKRFHKRFITKIEPIKDDIGICLKTSSPDECFLTKEYLVTHNTALALTIMKNIAIYQKESIAFFSLEMSNLQLTTRLISMICGLDSYRIKTGTLSDEDVKRMNNKVTPLIESNIHIDDTAGLTVREFKSKARTLKRKHDIKMIIVDYLQLMTANVKGGSRTNEVDEVSRSLKLVAKELNVPVIALSQLSRSVETRGGDKRPRLSDLRDSGSIEQDADIVMFLHRPEYYGINEIQDSKGVPMSSKGVTELDFQKHRNGSLDTAYMRFKATQTSFSDMNEDNNRLTPLENIPSDKDLEAPF